jgi:cysteine synthase A
MTTSDTLCLPWPVLTPLSPVQGFGYIKSENEQLTGSVKYRLVYQRICDALAKGEIDSKTCLVEASAGSTGVALAFAGQQLGLKVEIHVFEGDNPKVEKMESYGAKVKPWSRETRMETLLLYIKTYCLHKNGWHLNQYDRGLLRKAYVHFGDEILYQMHLNQFEPNHFLCPVGTGGLVHGVGEHLLKRWPEMKVIAFEPAPGVSLGGMRNADQMSMGPGDPYDKKFPDQRLFLEKSGPIHMGGRESMGSGAQLVLGRSLLEGFSSSLMLAVD